MKTKLFCSITGAVLALQMEAAPFVNLIFDEPDLTGSLTPIFPGGPLQGNAAEILRGWSVTVNGQPKLKMEYAPPGTGGGNQAYLVHNSTLGPHGPYALVLSSSFPNPPDVRVRQTGTIPADATGLWIASAGYIQAFADGIKIGEVNPLVGSQAILDVTALAGKDVSLEFAILPGSEAFFDIFGFTQVPEPSTWALLGVGLAALGWQAWRKR